jgi:uncharacterized protein YecE (DUF72 family)
MKPIHVGTSGWNYDHWRGPFYPEELSREEWFDYYRSRFDTVEINNTFYNLPSPQTVSHWDEATGDEFRYAVKASRYITHMKKLKDPEESSRRFFERMEPLGGKIDVVLFQLPPKWNRNSRRLASFLDTLPEGWRYAFEFRDESWFSQETYDLLRGHNAAFCIYELAGNRSPEVITADSVYVRLHGPEGAYQGSYSEEELKQWASKCRQWAEDGLEVRIYFDNDDRGFAPTNANTLKEALR